jgi:hypothetical protein
LQASQLQQGIAINYEVISRNCEGLSKSLFSLLGESGQLGDWERQIIANVTGMVEEFVNATSNELPSVAVTILKFQVYFLLRSALTIWRTSARIKVGHNLDTKEGVIR